MLIWKLLHPRNELGDAPVGGGASEPAPASPSSDSVVPSGDTPSPASGPTRGPDGRFTSSQPAESLHDAIWGKEGLAEAEAPPEAVPAKLPEDEKARAPEEDLTAPLDGSVSPQTQQRFQKLTHALKDRDRKIEAVAQQAQHHERRANEFVAILREAGVNENAFGEFIDYRGALKAGNFDAAAQFLKRQLREISLASGKNVAGDDSVLEEFPDLADRVRNMQMDETAALELARARRMEQAMRARGEHQQRTQHTQQQFQQAKTAALQSVAQQVAEWKRTDVDFRAKEQKIAAKVSRLKDLPPHQWLARVREFYEDISEGAGLVSAAKPVERPLSGGAAPSSTAHAPSSFHEAMWAPKA